MCILTFLENNSGLFSFLFFWKPLSNKKIFYSNFPNNYGFREPLLGELYSFPKKI